MSLNLARILSCIKICCICSVVEAVLAIRYGANAIGLVFVMFSGSGVIAEETIAEIAVIVPLGVATFLLTSWRDVDSIIAQQRCCCVNTFQFCDSIKQNCHSKLRTKLPNIALIQIIHVNNPQSINKTITITDKVNALLL